VHLGVHLELVGLLGVSGIDFHSEFCFLEEHEEVSEVGVPFVVCDVGD